MGYIQHAQNVNKQHALYADIASDFDQGIPNMVKYQDFINHLRYQTEKLSVLEQFFLSVKESMMFNQLPDLYTIFRPFDTSGYKSFNIEEVRDLFVSRGLYNTDKEVDYFISEYDTNKRQQAEFAEIEMDFRDFSEYFRAT